MRLGLIGYGAIGQTLLGLLSTEHGIGAVTILVRPGREAEVPHALPGSVPVTAVTRVDALIQAAPDIVVECAGQEAAAEYLPRVLESGIDAVLASVGTMANPHAAKRLLEAATSGGARLIIPPGAVGGIDILGAFASGGVLSVRYTGTKPPVAWAGSAAEEVVDLASVEEPTVFFSGDAREAALTYPKNANVAATVALAGAGFEATQVTLVADPAAAGNTYEVTATSDMGEIAIRIVNAPSRNARTSIATIHSILREIKNRRGPLVI